MQGSKLFERQLAILLAVAAIQLLPGAATAQRLGAFSPDRPLSTSDYGGDTAYTNVKFSQDGKMVLAETQKRVTVWNADGKQVFDADLGQSFDPGWHLHRADISADGKRVAAIAIGQDMNDGSTPQVIRIFDVPSGRVAHSISLNQDSYPHYSVALSPDGKTVAAVNGTDDATEIRLFGVETGKLMRSFSPFDQRIRCVTFSPDSRLLAAGGLDSKGATLRLWEVSTGKLYADGRWQSAIVNDIDFSSDGRMLASVSEDETVKLLTLGLDGVSLTGTLKCQTGWWTCRARFTRDNRMLLVKEHDKLNVWDIQKRQVMAALDGSGFDAFDATTSGDTLLVIGEEEPLPQRWNLAAALRRVAPVQRLTDLKLSPIYLAFEGSGAKFAAASKSGQFAVFDAAKFRAISEVTEELRGGQFTHGGEILVHQDGSLRLVSPLTRQSRPIVRLSNPTYAPAIAMSSDGTMTAVYLDERTHFLDAQWRPTDSMEAALTIHHEIVLSPDKHWLAAVRDNETTLFDLRTKQELAKQPVGGQVVFSSDNSFLLGTAGSYAGLWKLRLSNLEIDRPFTIYRKSPPAQIATVGKLLATAGEDDLTVRLWNVESGELLATLAGHEHPVTAVAISPDGRTVVSGGHYDYKGELLEWDVSAFAASPTKGADAPIVASGATWKAEPKTFKTTGGVEVTIRPSKEMTQREIEDAVRDVFQQLQAARSSALPQE